MANPGKDERAALLHFLTAQRQVAMAVLEGLSDADARSSVVPSGWTPFSMIVHLAGVERHWFAFVLGGDVAPAPARPGAAGTLAEAVADYRAEIERSDRLLAGFDVDEPPTRTPEELPGEILTVRDVVLHVIEETARQVVKMRRAHRARSSAGSRPPDDDSPGIDRPIERVQPRMSTSVRAAAGERPRSRVVLGHFAGRSATGLLALILATLVGAGLLYLASGLILALDRAVANGLNDLVAPSPTTVAVLEVLALPGESVVGWVVLGTLTLYLLLRRQPRLAAFVAVTGLGGAVLGPSIKALVGRVRPIVDAPVASAPGPSFPSGHTLTVTVVVGVLLLVLLPTAPPRARRPLMGWGRCWSRWWRSPGSRSACTSCPTSSAVRRSGPAGSLVTASALRSWRRDWGCVPPVERGLEPEAAAELVPSPDPEPAPVDGWTVAARAVVTAVLLLGVLLGAGLLVTRVLPGTGIADADADWSAGWPPAGPRGSTRCPVRPPSWATPP